MKSPYLLTIHFLLGIGIGWIDAAFRLRYIKRSPWMLNQSLAVLYLMSLVIELLIAALFSEQYLLYRSLLYAPVNALTMTVGLLAVRVVRHVWNETPEPSVEALSQREGDEPSITGDEATKCPLNSDTERPHDADATPGLSPSPDEDLPSSDGPADTTTERVTDRLEEY